MSDEFVIEPYCLRFGPEGTGFEDMKRSLEESSSTKPIEIKRPEDILLSLDGRVQDYYRFTPFGLYTLCRKLSPNLGSVISDLAGTSGRPSAKFRSDVRAAVSVLNTVIRLRFEDAIQGSRMIVDPVRRTIDGLVGTRYEFLGNHELFETCSKFAESRGAQWLSGALVGRRMLLRYVLPDNGVDADDEYYTLGWSFSNSETGQSAVKAGLLFVDSEGFCSMRNVLRRQHTSGLRDGGQWLTEQIKAASAVVNWEAIARSMERLQASYLPRCTNSIQAAKYSDQLTAGLAKTISKYAARDIARAMFTPSQVMVGSSSWTPPTSPIPELPGGNSFHLLYEAMTRKAGDYPPQDQENIESLAYELLRGRFKPMQDA